MFTPENQLEESLMKAADDPAHRPQFYRDFVNSDILVVRHGPPPEREAQTVLEAGMQLQIAPVELNGKTYLPIFSSLPRLQAVIEEEVGYLRLNALKFLEITRGADVMLNPGSGYGKEFTKDEIASLIDGTIWEPSATHLVERETEVLLGQPARYPHALTDALSRLFKNRKEVRAAYVAHFHDPSRTERAHTLVGVEAADDFEAVVAEAGIVARDIEVPDPPVEFIRVGAGGGLDDYFLKSSEPFYRRKRFGIF